MRLPAVLLLVLAAVAGLLQPLPGVQAALQPPRPLGSPAVASWHEVQYYYEPQQQSPVSFAQLAERRPQQQQQRFSTTASSAERFSETPLMADPLPGALRVSSESNPVLRLRRTAAAVTNQSPLHPLEARLLALETAMQQAPPAFAPPLQSMPQPQMQPQPQVPFSTPPLGVVPQPQQPQQQQSLPPPVQQQPAAFQAQPQSLPPLSSPQVGAPFQPQSPPMAATGPSSGDGAGGGSQDEWTYTLPIWGFGALCAGACMLGMVLACLLRKSS